MSIWLSPFEYLTRILGGDYLESGFYDLKSPGKCTPQAYKPATLHYSATTASYVSSTNTPLQGSATFDRGVWSPNTQYPIGHPITPESENDFTKVWISQNAGATDVVEPTWVQDEAELIMDGGIIWRFQENYGAGQDEEPFNGQALANGSESLSVGCSNKLETITDPCGTTHLGGGFCSTAIFQKKDAQFKIPSSTYSGKLRLYVQALYGSNRTDYRRSVLNLSIGEGSAEFPRVELSRSFPNKWLYTTDSFQYFLVDYASGQTENSGVLSFTFLQLSVQGEGYRRLLNLIPRVATDYEFRNRVEAYILSTAKVKAEPLYVIPVTGPPVSGSPLEYGWHSNWKGDTSDIITFYSDGANKRYLSNHFKIAISETTVPGGFIFTAQMTNPIVDSPWWPRTNLLHVFAYNPMLQVMQEIPFPSNTFGGFEGTFDAPIYCFYTYDISTNADSLSICRIKMDLDGSKPPKVLDLSGDKAFSSAGHTYFDKETYNGITGSTGFSVGAFSLNMQRRSTSFKSKASVSPTSSPSLSGGGLFFGTTGSGTEASDGAISTSAALLASTGKFAGETREVNGNTQYVKVMVFHFIWTSEVETFSQGESLSTEGFFQIVLGDCSKVIYGKRGTSSHGGRFVGSNPRIDKGIGAQVFWSSSDLAALSPALVEVIATLPSPTFVINRPTYDDTINPSRTVSNEPPNIDAPVITEQVSEISVSGLSIIPGVIGKFDRYFRPTTSLPHTGSVDYARNSLHNEGRTDHSKYTSDQGYLNDNSVGWQ